jgi:alkylation response protein AidB-like acyl-CoA dehydrogenase
MRDLSGRGPAEPPLEGHVHPSNPLSPRTAFDGLARPVRRLVRYAPRDMWEQDTATLPRGLAAYRRRMRAFAERHLQPAALPVDAAPHPSTGTLEAGASKVLHAAARAGLLSDMLPRPFGSGSLRLIRTPIYFPAALKTEELASVDGGLMLLLCAHSLGVAPVLLSGEVGAVRRFLVPAFRESMAGRPHVFAYAITEPAGGSDVEDGHGASTHRPGTVAHPDGTGWRLRGRKCFISGGDIARSVVVLAALEGEGMESWTAFLVRSDDPGFRVARTELKMGMRASGAAEIELDDVRIPADRILGGLRGGWALNRATLNMSRIPVAAMGVGFARAATEAATEFACRFRLGGRPLVSHQEVQLALADMMAETQAARAMVWRLAGRWGPTQREASAAKVHCTDTALRVCTRAMDLLGNHAVLHGQRVEKAYRDARLTQIFEGTNQINRLAMIEDEQERLLAMIHRLEQGADHETSNPEGPFLPRCQDDPAHQ